MNQAIHEILDRAEEYADRKGDPSLRNELKTLERVVTSHVGGLEAELNRCRSLISEMARASQADSDLILELRKQLSDEQHVIERHFHNVRRVKRDHDIVVQVRVDGAWQDRASYNEMSNDFASTESIRFAWDMFNQINAGVTK